MKKILFLISIPLLFLSFDYSEEVEKIISKDHWEYGRGIGSKSHWEYGRGIGSKSHWEYGRGVGSKSHWEYGRGPTFDEHPLIDVYVGLISSGEDIPEEFSQFMRTILVEFPYINEIIDLL